MAEPFTIPDQRLEPYRVKENYPIASNKNQHILTTCLDIATAMKAEEQDLLVMTAGGAGSSLEP